MKEKLLELLENAYAPYSNYKVASIVVTKDGKEFSGVNVENASYGATICAERNAVNSAIAAGYKKGDFVKIYLMAEIDKIIYPCFICRQVIAEFFEEESILIIVTSEEETIHTMDELIPYPFTDEDL